MEQPCIADDDFGIEYRFVEADVSEANIAWILISTALVLLMTPALGFFYSGFVRSKNTLNTLVMSFAALGFVGLAWMLIGYSLAFDSGTPIIGGVSHGFLQGVGLEESGTIPHLLFMAFQGTFAVITAALISGAVVERMRFPAYLAFIVLWSVLIYAPVAHWVWGGGWLGELGALDFAGGTVVHINAGVAAVVLALVLGSRKDYGRQAMLPGNIPLTLLGTAFLWLGWFGFNAGSALAADEIAVLAFVNTMVAPMATLVVWSLIDLTRTGKVTAIGLATAVVVGLVAVTPAAGFVSPLGAIALGAIAAVPSYYAVLYRPRTRLDDSLDVFAAHGVGGISGALLTGVLAQESWNGVGNGLLFGDPGQLGTQIVAVLAVIAFSGIGTFGILKLIELVTTIRVDLKSEGLGLDISEHGEQAYLTGEGAVLLPPSDLRLPEAAPSPTLSPSGGDA